MAEPSNEAGSDDKAARRAARDLVAAYQREQLGALLERVRDGFAQLDHGRSTSSSLMISFIATNEPPPICGTFCGSSGGQWLQAANMLTYLCEQGEEPDWWASSAPRRDGC